MRNTTRTRKAINVSIEQLREVAARLATECALNLVVLFGSARYPERHPEDLDLALQGDQPLDLVALTNRFIQELHVQAIDLADLRRADPLLMALVARDGLVLFERAPGIFATFASLAARRYNDTQKFRDAERDHIRAFIRATVGAP